MSLDPGSSLSSSSLSPAQEPRNDAPSGMPDARTLQAVTLGTRAGDAETVGGFLRDHPEQKQQLQDMAFAAGNYTLFHQLSQPAAGPASAPATAPVAAAQSSASASAHEPPTLPREVREAGFALRHPQIALEVGQFQSGSTNISTNAVRFAALGTPGQPGSILGETPNREGSQINAFRHTLWQATIAGRYGESIARQVGAAHEENPNADLSRRDFPTSAEADQTIDLLNNQIGRGIGAAHAGASMHTLAERTLEAFHDQGLYVGVPNGSGGVRVERMRLPDDQYHRMRTALAGVNDNAFTPAQQAAKDQRDREAIEQLQWQMMIGP